MLVIYHVGRGDTLQYVVSDTGGTDQDRATLG